MEDVVNLFKFRLIDFKHVATNIRCNTTLNLIITFSDGDNSTILKMALFKKNSKLHQNDKKIPFPTTYLVEFTAEKGSSVDWVATRGGD